MLAWVLAAVAVGALALRPRSAWSAAVVLGAAALDVLLRGVSVEPSLRAVAPMLAFLTAALTLAALVERAGLAERAADGLARRAHGSMVALYVATCVLCALLTAIVSLAAAALAAWAAAPLGWAPWWPFAAVAALALATAPASARPRPIVPWRLGCQVAGLLVVTGALGVHLRSPATLGLAGLAGIALGVGAGAALANNLPVSVCVAGLLSAGPSAYAALIGLGVGSLATPHGSLATLIATDLAGERAPRPRPLRTAALAAAGVLLAALLLWGAA